MAIVTYPLNNIEYTAESAEIYNSTRTSGVFAFNAFEFSVTGADSYITIGPGMAWIKNAEFSGKAIAHKEDTVLVLPIPDAVFPRIDVVALQFDKALNATNLVIKQGTAASSPAIPAIVQTEMLYELYLYAVRREVGTLVVLESNVTDLRPDEKYCGLMRDGVTRDTAIPDGSITTEKFALDAKAPFADMALNGIYQLTYAKSSTTHTLSGLSGAAGTLSCVFTASADYAKGDTFTVDGENYTVKQQNGEEAGDKLFAAGAVVSCIIDTAGKTVNFKSGGGGGVKVASGTATGSNNNLTVAGLDFEPTRIEITVTKSPSTTGASSFYCASYTAGQKMTIVYKGAPGYNTPVVEDVTTDSKYSGVQYAYADGTVTFTSHINSDEYICGFKAVPYRWVAWREE